MAVILSPVGNTEGIKISPPPPSNLVSSPSQLIVNIAPQYFIVLVTFYTLLYYENNLF